MNKKFKILTIAVAAAAIFTACGSSEGNNQNTPPPSSAPVSEAPKSEAPASEKPSEEQKSSFDTSNDIVVISREDGSGTRGAFIELTGVEGKNDAGEKIDNTTEDASIKNSTAAVITTVSGNDYAIGYISLGSLNDTVKTLKVDEVEATADNIKAGTYKIARPFNIATKEGVSEVAQDFIDFILSKEGQDVVTENKYIAINENALAYAGTKPEGKIVVAGSSSISPVMEKLKEAYEKVNTNAVIEIQTSDSSTGMTATTDGLCDIGMASRELKDSELEKGLIPQVIAMDGIAIIVNNNNTTENISVDTIKKIFTGEAATWEEALAE
ncbi:substrate-binding domain-containing protein [Anaeropeptidivorans aminofermentans]|uniref:substrate-binding domain-containing protein n=1 Tax=Anaeropeptidivorans aminofermentans TaxID=2934315 RepID=UPI00202566A2|nr:substrate-binding domain-containing protein [Anaeropeptidivorans aminofermentans]